MQYACLLDSILEIGSRLGLSDRTVNRILEEVRSVWRTSGLLGELQTEFDRPSGATPGNAAAAASRPGRPILSRHCDSDGSAPPLKHALAHAD